MSGKTYWICKRCEKPFRVGALSMKEIKKSRQSKPFCPFCKSQLTQKSNKEAHDAHYLKKDIERDNEIMKSLDVWYKGGKMTYLGKLKKQ